MMRYYKLLSSSSNNIPSITRIPANHFCSYLKNSDGLKNICCHGEYLNSYDLELNIANCLNKGYFSGIQKVYQCLSSYTRAEFW